MIDSLHHIEKQIFEIQTKNAERAIIIQNQISDLARKILKETINEVLDKYEIPDKQIRIDQISIDLGVIEEKHLVDELPERLRGELAKILSEKLSYLESDFSISHTGISVQPTPQSRLEIIQYFFKKGSLPWWGKAEKLSLFKLIDEQIEKKQSGFYQLIEEFSSDPIASQRIALQLSETQLLKMIDDKVGVHLPKIYDIILSLSRKSGRTFTEQQHIKRKLLIWSFQFVNQHKGTFDRESFLTFLQTKGSNSRIELDISQDVEKSTFHPQVLKKDKDIEWKWEALSSFIEAGFFHENYGAKIKSLNSFFLQLLDETPVQLEYFFQNYEDIDQAAIRLSRQLSFDVLERFTILLAGNYRELVGVYLKDLFGRLNSKEEEDKEFKRLVFQELIKVLVNDREGLTFQFIRSKIETALVENYTSIDPSFIKEIFPHLIESNPQQDRGEGITKSSHPIEIDIIAHFIQHNSFPTWDENLYTSKFRHEIHMAINDFPSDLRKLLFYLDPDQSIARFYEHLEAKTIYKITALLGSIDLKDLEAWIYQNLDSEEQTRKEQLRQLIKEFILKKKTFLIGELDSILDIRKSNYSGSQNLKDSLISFLNNNNKTKTSIDKFKQDFKELLKIDPTTSRTILQDYIKKEEAKSSKRKGSLLVDFFEEDMIFEIIELLGNQNLKEDQQFFLSEILKLPPNTLYKYFKIHSPTLLLQNLTEEELNKVIEHIYPSFFGFIISLEIIAREVEKTATKTKSPLKDILFQTLFNQPFDLNIEILTKDFVHELSRRLNQPFPIIGSKFKRIVEEKMAKGETRFYPFEDIISRINSENTKGDFSEKDQPREEKEEEKDIKNVTPLEQLQFFIKHGSLLRISGSLSMKELDKYLIELLDRGSVYIISYLRSAPLDRIITQFSEEALFKWTGLMIQDVDIEKVFRFLEFIFEKEEALFKVEDSRKIIWKTLIETINFYLESDLNKSISFGPVLLRKLSQDYEIPVQVIEDWLLKSWDKLEKTTQQTLLALGFVNSEDQLPIEEPSVELDEIDKSGDRELIIDSRLDLLGYLIRTDPEKIKIDSTPNLDLLIHELSIKSPDTLKDWFTNQEDFEPLVQSFILQVKEKTLWDLVKIYEPDYAGFFKGFLLIIQRLYEHEPTVFSNVREVKKIKWFPIIQIILTKGVKDLNLSNLINETIKFIEKESKLKATKIEAKLLFLTKKAVDTNLDFTVLEELLEKLREEQKFPAETVDSEEFDILLLLDVIKNKSQPAQKENVENRIYEEIAARPLVMREILWNVLKDPAYRIEIQQQLSPQFYKELIKLLQPLAYEDIHTFTRDLENLINKKIIQQQLLEYLYQKNYEPFVLKEFIQHLFENYGGNNERYIKLLESSVRFLEVAQTPSWQTIIIPVKELLAEQVALPNRIENPIISTPSKEIMEENIYVNNAGLVILSPFLIRYFDVLGMTEERVFKDDFMAERAVHLLQFMVDGRTETPEYELALNKVLCGVPLTQPIIGGIEISESELEMSKKLLESVIGNWEKMKSLPISNFRGSFLNREGRLKENFENWNLKVESKPFDALLDSLPWGISMIKLPWMEKILNVDWR